jgi:hypothetical protein
MEVEREAFRAALHFDLADERQGTLEFRNISGASLGLVLRGPRKATSCAIATDPGTGLAFALANPEYLAIITGPRPSTGILRQLQLRTKDKETFILQTADLTHTIIEKHLPAAQKLTWENPHHAPPDNTCDQTADTADATGLQESRDEEGDSYDITP